MKTELKIIQICNNGIQNALWATEATDDNESKCKQALTIKNIINNLQNLLMELDGEK